MRVGLDEDFLLSETDRNDLVTDSRTVLQKERELGAEGLVVDFTEVAETRPFEVEAFNVVHRKPAAVNLLHSVLDNQVLERLVDVAPRVGRQMELQGIGGLEIFHGLDEPLSLLHQTFDDIRWQ